MADKHLIDWAEEKQQLLEKNGYYVPIYRFVKMSKLSSKIVNMLMSDAEFAPSYGSAKLVLEMAMMQLELATQKRE